MKQNNRNSAEVLRERRKVQDDPVYYQVEKLFRHTLSFSKCFLSHDWEFHLLLNPAAGGFNHSGLRKTFGGREPGGLSILRESSAEVTEERIASCEASEVNVVLHLSAYPGHIAAMAKELSRAASSKPRRSLIISLGGDGTHHEVLNALVAEGGTDSLARCLLFRFPLGSGNDAADAWSAAEAWNLLIEGGDEQYADALFFKTATNTQYLAFNIASVGIDAHIAMVTDNLKNKLPGDLYKPVADLSVPLYPGIYKISSLELKAVSDDGKELSHRFRLGLLAMGVGGNRCYGHGLWILPGDENICSIRLGSLGENLKMKKYLYKGRHGELPFVKMFKSRSFVLHYSGRIPMQLDGEVHILDAQDFPVDVSIHSTQIRVLSGRRTEL